MISHICRAASRWIFFAALVYAPWAYGATTSESIQITNWILLAALVLWAVQLLFSRREPRFPRLLFFLTVALICTGGLMVFNAKSIYDSDFLVFVPLRNLALPLAGCFFEPGLAIECRSRHPGLRQTAPSWDARGLGDSFYRHDRWGAGEYLAYGSLSRTAIGDRNMPAVWTGGSSKLFGWREKHRLP